MNNIDYIESQTYSGKKGLLEYARKQDQESKEKNILDKLKEYGKTALKGTVEGISRLGTIISPTYETPSIEEGKVKLGRGSKEKQLEEQTETLNRLLPTEEGFGQKALRRGLRELPSAIGLGGAGTAPRALVAGLFGQTAEELGAPELVQTAAELTAYLSPNFTKKLLESGKNKEIIEAGKKLGLSDQQITPLIQSDFKKKWLSKMSPKRGATQKAISSTKSGLEQSYQNIQGSSEAKNYLPADSQKKLFKSFYDLFTDMPSGVRNKVKEDFSDLLKKPITGETLINFYKDVNHNLGGKTKQLSRLKQPMREALSEISPQLGKDFEDINKLYTKYHDISSHLKPSIASDLVSAAENIGLMGSMFTGNIFGLKAILSEKATRKLAQQMLINPRLQQLSKKMVKAMNENKYSTVKKLTEAYSKQLEDSVPEASEILDTITEDEIKNLFKKNK